MDPERRRLLEQRRRELKQDRQEKKRIESVGDRTRILDANGVPYRLILDDDRYINWIGDKFPITGGLSSKHVDWDNVPVHEPGPDAHADPPEARIWLINLSRKHALGDCNVVLCPGNGYNPCIALSFQHVIAYPQVVSDGFEIWVICEAEEWLIEFWWSDALGWRWGRAIA